MSSESFLKESLDNLYENADIRNFEFVSFDEAIVKTFECGLQSDPIQELDNENNDISVRMMRATSLGRIYSVSV